MSNQVTYIFNALDRFSAVGRKVAKATEKVTNKLKKLRNTTVQTNKASKKAAIDISASFNRMATAAAAFVSINKVIGEGSKFQDSLANLSSITGAAGKDLEFFSKQALALAKNGGVMQSSVVDAITDIASAKSELLKDPEGLVKITEQAILLANAAGITLPDAVNASVGALNQFNVGSEEAARFVNVLAAGSKVGAARVSEIVESMKNAGSVASQFNVSFEETNSLLQVLAKNGIKGAEAGTALRGTLSKLEKIANGQLAPSKIGILESLDRLKKAQLSNTQIIKEFGEENLRSILILQKNVPLIKQWTKELTGTNIAQEQADKRLATFNAKFRKLGITLNEALIKTFLKLEPILSKQIVQFTEFVQNLKPEQIEGFALMVEGLGKGIAVLGQGLAFVFKQLKRIATIIGEVTAAIVSLDFSHFTQSFTDFGKGFTKDLSELINVDITGAIHSGLDSLLGSADKAAVQEFSSRTDVNVNLSAPEGTVDSIKSKTSGKNPGLNVGVNMASAL